MFSGNFIDPNSDLFIKRIINQQEDIIKKSFYLVASGSINYGLINDNIFRKYNYASEGYLGGRVYRGQMAIDILEDETERRARMLFQKNFVIVQPNSGSNANIAAIKGILSKGDTVLAMSLESGGHLTHLSKPSALHEDYKTIFYTTDNNFKIDYEDIREKVLLHKPKLIISGASSYPFNIDFERIYNIAKEVNSIMLADISHISGFVASKIMKVKADIITTSFWKSLLGPKGGMILCDDRTIFHKIKRAFFPGLNGTQDIPNLIEKCASLGFAQSNQFKEIMISIIKNCEALKLGIKKTSPQTEVIGEGTHMIILNNIPKNTDINLEKFNIITNKNILWINRENRTERNAIRIGTIFTSSEGIGEETHFRIGEIIGRIINGERDENILEEVKLLRDIKI